MSAILCEEALALRALCIPTLPTRQDKHPALEHWGDLQGRLPTPEEIAEHHANGYDLAAVMGTVSGHLVTLDLEEAALAEPLRAQVRELAGPELLERLVMACTPRGGKHWYYRHPGPSEPGQVLARDARGSIAIETRAEGNYAVIPPSEGRSYLQGTLRAVSTISRAEHSCLRQAACSLHVPPPDPLVEKERITRAVLLDQCIGVGEKMVFLGLLQDLSFENWLDVTTEEISQRYHMGLRQAKERLRALVARGLIKERCVFGTDALDRPRPRYLRRLDRDTINDYWCPKGPFTSAPLATSPTAGDFYDRFNALVSIRELLEASPVAKLNRLNKFLAFWRGERHASVHLHPADATCPYEHCCDYGDNNRHLDAFDMYCLVRGFYRWDGSLHLNKHAGMRAAAAEYPALQSKSSEKEPVIIDGVVVPFPPAPPRRNLLGEEEQ